MDPFWQELISGLMQQVVVPMLAALLLALLSYLALSAKKYLDTHATEAERNTITECAKSAVWFVEQWFADKSNQDKLVLATQTFNAYLSHLNAKPVDPGLAKVVLEAAVGSELPHYSNLESIASSINMPAPAASSK
jgi:Bacteriophage holin of superfamily 6 (Holin_LLH)